MITPYVAPTTPRGCRACGRPFSASTSFGLPLCPGCSDQARLTAAVELARARENLEGLLERRNSNSLLPLYHDAQDAVAALVRLEGSGALVGNAAAWLARRMDDGRETLLSLALRRRMGTDGDPHGRHKMEGLVHSLLKDLDEIGGEVDGEVAKSPRDTPTPYSELRQYSRTSATLPVLLDPGKRDATSRDLSPGGAFVCCSPLPPVGQRLTLTFFAGAKRRSAVARVRWAAAEGVGVEFSQEQVGAPFGG